MKGFLIKTDERERTIAINRGVVLLDLTLNRGIVIDGIDDGDAIHDEERLVVC